ncbi:MAG TPA: S9 family peptidase [Acidimicrobiales bacterium]
MTQRVAPYGTWASPVTPERLVEAVVRLSQLQVHDDSVYWVESRPAEGGREVIVRATPQGHVTDAIPEGFNARTRVHEYGGRCYALHGDRLVFSNWNDQRLWLKQNSSAPVPLTPEPPEPASHRYADPVFTADGGSVVCVRERHLPGGEVVNDLVAVPSNPRAGQEPRVLAAGHDFYAAPRISPDGTRLAWLTWDLPDMPWESTVLWTAGIGGDTEVGTPAPLAGGPNESVTQPRWSPAGVLHYVSDRTGWWNLYDEDGTALCPVPAEFGRPDWTFGASTYTFVEDGPLVAAWGSKGVEHLGVVAEGRAEPLSPSFSYYSSVVAAGRSVIAIAASPTEAAAVVRLDTTGSVAGVLRRSQEPFLEPPGVSVPQPVDYSTGGGDTAHLLFYPPASADFVGPEEDAPPVVVFIHGGPTGQAVPAFDRGVQYWTSRGFAVADINYRGSSGFGRAYRDLLQGRWGIADIEDCAAAIDWLHREGLVDGTRAVIRGGSAGGFTVLAALAFTNAFAAGASLYGVADLELLAKDTHKFESHYLDSLVGPWPEDADEYKKRSPLYHVDEIASPLILFQGSEDKVVPPEQSRLMYEALTERGVQAEYFEFEGEQHGFRKAETVVAVARAELDFYLRVLAL